jgi:Amt family ammonium transporter
VLDTGAVVSLFLTLLSPCALAGIALINCGLTKSRSAAHSLLSSLAVAATAVLVHCLMTPIYGQFGGLLSMFAVALAAMIPVGAAAERWRLSAAIVSTVLLAGAVWPAFAHLAWAGWLARQGFIDTGGASAIHAVGGLTALAITRILGPRRGKYPDGAITAAIPGHSAPYVLFGCFVAWIGWIGMNGAGAIVFANVSAIGIPVVAANTTLAAAAGLLAALATTRIRFGKTDASLCANGWVGGLVASSACATYGSPGAILVGAAAGVLVVFSVEWLEVHFKTDDPGGVISVHAIAGLLGIIAIGRSIQLVGVGVLVAIILPASYALNWVLNRVLPQRVPPEAEQQGADLHELGAGAYPDFQSYNEELW